MTNATYQQVKGFSKPKLVEQIKEALKGFKSADKKIQSQADYFKKTSDSDLKAVDKSILVEALCNFLGIAKEVAVENQLKPKETQTAMPPANFKNEEPKVTPHEQDTAKSLLRAKMFPDVVTNDKLTAVEVNRLIIQPDITIEQILERVKNGDILFVAQYWSESHITQYNYYDMVKRPASYKKFPNDLDLQLVRIVTTEEPDKDGKVNLDNTNILAMSIYTQGFFNLQAKCLKNVSEGIRYDNGCEFHIYLGEVIAELPQETSTPVVEEPESQEEEKPVDEATNEPEAPAEPPEQKESPKPTLNRNKNRGKSK